MILFLQVSLLLADASQQMAVMARGSGCGNAAHYDAIARCTHAVNFLASLDFPFSRAFVCISLGPVAD